MKRIIERGLAISVAALTATGIVLVSTGMTASAAKPLATAVLLDTSGNKVGEVVFKGTGTYADRVEVELEAAGAPNKGMFHGFHVHSVGECNPLPSGSTNVPFGSAGSHWNPTGASHGDHAGDMPSVLITAEGETYAEFETDRFNVTALLDAAGDGAAVVLHVDRDNFAHIPTRYGTADTTTLGTGDAGGRYACGVIQPA